MLALILVINIIYNREVHDREIRISMLEEAQKVYERHGFETLMVSKRLENHAPEGWNRGDSCIHILRSLYGVDWEERVKVAILYHLIFFYCIL